MNTKNIIARRAAVAAGAGLAGLMMAACQGAAIATTASGAHSNPVATATTIAPAIQPTAAAQATSTSTGVASAGAVANTSAATTPAPCGNGDVRTVWGQGTQSEPLQASAVLFTNISDHTCTLQGYAGASITVNGTIINATRVLNGPMSDVPHMSAPPLVTLTPGASAHAMLQWSLHTSQVCYPTGTGEFKATAPNTTTTAVLGTGAQIGLRGICSNLEIGPVEPGTFGTPSGS